MMSTSEFENVRDFLAEITVEPASGITLRTRLREDLHLDGDEVDYLLAGLVDRFGIDLAEFDFYRYFRDEPNLLSPALYLWQGLRLGRWHTTPITVSHLVRVVQIGRWVNVNSSNKADSIQAE